MDAARAAWGVPTPCLPASSVSAPASPADNSDAADAAWAVDTLSPPASPASPHASLKAEEEEGALAEPVSGGDSDADMDADDRLAWHTFEGGLTKAAAAVRRRRARLKAEGDPAAVVVVAVGGASGSGKSYFSSRLAAAAGGAAVLDLAQYVDAGQAPGEDRDVGIEHLDLPLLLANLGDLAEGKPADTPLACTARRARIGFARVEPASLVILEGVHALHAALREHVHYSVALVGGAHYELARRARRARKAAASPPSSPRIRRTDSVVGRLFPDFDAQLETLSQASLRVTNDFEPLALCVRDPLHVVKTEAGIDDNASKARAMDAFGDGDSERVTYSAESCEDFYLRPPRRSDEAHDTCGAAAELPEWIRHRQTGARRTVMFRNWLSDQDNGLILSTRAQYEVGSAVLPALLSMGFEVVATVRRRTVTFTDGALSVCFEHVTSPALAAPAPEGTGLPRALSGRFMLVKGADKQLVMRAAERLGMVSAARLTRSTLQLALAGRALPDGGVPQVAVAPHAKAAARPLIPKPPIDTSAPAAADDLADCCVAEPSESSDGASVTPDPDSKPALSPCDSPCDSPCESSDGEPFDVVVPEDLVGYEAPPDPAPRTPVDSDWRLGGGGELLPFREKDVSIDQALFLAARAVQLLRERESGAPPVVVGISGPRGSGVTSLARALSKLLGDVTVLAVDDIFVAGREPPTELEDLAALVTCRVAWLRTQLRRPAVEALCSPMASQALIVEGPPEVFACGGVREALDLHVQTAGGLSLHLSNRVREDAAAAGVSLAPGSPAGAILKALAEPSAETDDAGKAPPHLQVLNAFDALAPPLEPVFEAAVRVSQPETLRLLEGPAPIVSLASIAAALGVPEAQLVVQRREWQDFFLVPPGASTAVALSWPAGRWMRVRREGTRARVLLGARHCPYAMWLRSASGAPAGFRGSTTQPLGTPALRRPEFEAAPETLAGLLATGYRIVGATTLNCTQYVARGGSAGAVRSTLLIESVAGAPTAHTTARVRGADADGVAKSVRALHEALADARSSRAHFLRAVVARCAASAAACARSDAASSAADLLLADRSAPVVALEGAERLEASLLVAAVARGIAVARLQASVCLANRRRALALRATIARCATRLALLASIGLAAGCILWLGGSPSPPPSPCSRRASSSPPQARINLAPLGQKMALNNMTAGFSKVGEGVFCFIKENWP